MKNNKKLPIVVLWAIALLVLASCQSKKSAEYIQTEGFVYGTTYHIAYQSPEGNNLDSAIQQAFLAIDNSLSMFNPNSTIAKFNTHDSIGTTDSLFMHVVTEGLKVNRLTQGAFDMTVAPLVNLWGFGFKERGNVTSMMVDSLMQYVGSDKININKNSISKQYPQTMLDASAIAKGFACDYVADALRAQGVTNLLVEIGGEVTAQGKNKQGDDWRIGINKPVEDSTSTVSDIQRVISFTNAGLATSGNYRNFYMKEGKKYSHTIDPKTGYPVQHSLLSATIIAPNCMTADAFATACMVMGLEKSLELCNSTPDIEGFFIYDNNGTLAETWSKNFPIGQ